MTLPHIVSYSTTFFSSRIRSWCSNYY